MGKVKNSLIEEQEVSMNSLDKDYELEQLETNSVEQAFSNRAVLARIKPVSKEEWVAWGRENQQNWADCSKEFEAWLDAYESSFGDGEPT